MAKTKAKSKSKAKPKSVPKSIAKAQSNQKYIVLAITLGLALIGYYGYKSMMVKPDINKVSTPNCYYRGSTLICDKPTKTPVATPSKDKGERDNIKPAATPTKPVATPVKTKNAPTGAVKVKN